MKLITYANGQKALVNRAHVRYIGSEITDMEDVGELSRTQRRKVLKVQKPKKTASKTSK